MAETEQTPKYTPNTQSDVYDKPGNVNPLSSPDLSKQENKTSSGSASKAAGSPSTAKSLNNSEGGGFYKNSSNYSAFKQGLKAGAGGEVSLAKTATKAALGFFTSHKKGTAVGGGIGGLLILLLIVGSGFLVSHELVTIEKTLLKYEAKIEQEFEKTKGRKLMQKIICVRTQNCKPKTESDGQDQNAQDENADPAASASGEELTSEINTAASDLTSPTVKGDLAKVGITESTTGGGLTLKDSTGTDITDSISNNTSGAGDLMETAIPEFAEGQVTSLGPIETLHAGVTEDPITSENEKDPTKAVENDVLNGASEAEIVADASVVDQQSTTNPTTAETTTFNQGVQDGGVLSSELSATDSAIAAGESSAQAIAAGEAAAGGITVGNTLLASSIASETCSIDKVATNAAKSRVPKIITLLIRHGMLVLSLADELKSGHLNGGVVNKVMGLFNGDPSSPPTVDPTTGKSSPSVDSLPFSSSEEYQKATGGSGGVPIDSSSLPTANAGTSVVNTINAVLKDSIFGSATCAVENSPFGFIANGLAGGIQLIGDIGSLGLTQVLTTAGLVVFQQMIQKVVIPEILRYFTPVGLDGLESSVQLGNNAGLGMNLASTDYARSEGANPVSSTTANTLANLATQEQNIAVSHLSWFDRTFALSNTDSLVSRLITHIPLGISATVNSAMNYLMTIPSSLLHSLSTIFYPKALAQTTTTAPGVSDGVTQYAFTNSALDKYDPILNENYLFSNLVTYKGVSMQRIVMLGNPNTVQVNTSGDEIDSTNNLVTNDLLHCYVDSFTDLQEAQSTSPGKGIDTNCYDPGVYALGSYDYTDSTPASADQMDGALDSAILGIYCTAFSNNPSVSGYSSTGCLSAVSKQIQDDIGHFRQYILDVHVMKDYTNLMTNQ